MLSHFWQKSPSCSDDDLRCCGFIACLMESSDHTRWAPTSCKWSYRAPTSGLYMGNWGYDIYKWSLLPRLQLLGGPTLYQYVFAVHTSPKRTTLATKHSVRCVLVTSTEPPAKKKKSQFHMPTKITPKPFLVQSRKFYSLHLPKLNSSPPKIHDDSKKNFRRTLSSYKEKRYM